MEVNIHVPGRGDVIGALAPEEALQIGARIDRSGAHGQLQGIAALLRVKLHVVAR